MQDSAARAPDGRADGFPMGMTEFVALIAAMMGMNALAIDPMLPALPAIGAGLDVADDNARQWVITAYTLGLGFGALVYGSLSDHFGRRPVLLVTFALYLAATLACALAASMPMLLAGRAAAGVFAAATRVVAIGIVRDRFVGDRMASIMSTVFIVFMIVPVFAPAFGQLVLYAASWRWIFGALLVIGAATALWTYLRLPETLRPEHRVAIHPAAVAAQWGVVLRTRGAIGYMLAAGLVMSALFGFITSVQQIFYDTFGAAAIFPFAFALIAGTMAVGSFFNSRLVMRVGARRMAHGSLILMIALSALHSLVAWAGWETLASFIVLQALTMLSFSFVGPNFGSISMEPFARGAGAASSFQAALTTVLGASLGAAIGLQFDGTTLPLALGYLACSLAALAVVLWAEHGRLFTRPHLPKLPQPTR
jgi:DHA1 family bicyclomycin/chloramphenicol resistance-like MFS transporter